MTTTGSRGSKLLGVTLSVTASDNAHEALDELKRMLAAEVAARFPPALIRSRSLGNLHRWKKNGTWGPVYKEWQNILESENDDKLIAVLLGRDDDSNRLRQSPPYVGMLPREVLKRLREKIMGFVEEEALPNNRHIDSDLS